MIKGMPAYASTAIQNYLDTGNFKNHEKQPIEGQNIAEDLAHNRRVVDEYIAKDNKPGKDLDGRDGFIKTDEKYLGIVEGRHSNEDGVQETFQFMTGDLGTGVFYTRDDGKTMDTIFVSDMPDGDEESVEHLDSVNPANSFSTHKPE